MHKQQETDVLTRIFSDAQVKDIDLSEWDRRLTLCVIADHFIGDTGGRRPVYLVNFYQVRSLSVSFNHLEVELPEPDIHFQWQVDTSSFDQVEGSWHVRLSGLIATPTVELTCERIDHQPVEHRDMDRHLPGWDSPSAGFARPGIAAMIASRKRN